MLVGVEFPDLTLQSTSHVEAGDGVRMCRLWIDLLLAASLVNMKIY